MLLAEVIAVIADHRDDCVLGDAELLAVRRREECLRQLRHMLHTALRVRGPSSRLSGPVSVQYQRLLGEVMLALLRRPGLGLRA